MSDTVRVRYAPSPTGLQHIGGVRTALFNYFFARARGGTFILRVEDTDRTRFHPAALQDIYDTFAWLGISIDEGPSVGGPYAPYVQSERVESYREHAARLVEAGRAYYDYTSGKDEAGVDRHASEGEGDAAGGDETASESRAPSASGGAGESSQRAPYNYEGRNLTPDQISAYQAAGVRPVVRLLIPLEGETEFNDMLLGRIRRKNKDLPADPVLLKSDGFPTYHLANVIDDHYMQITHVMRAQEWIPSTPLHLLIYAAFGWEPPTFCHLPMVMGKDGSKLSKRHGATSVIEFRKAGYLSEAVVNYMAMLGWSYDDSREFFTREELEQVFDAARLNKAPAVFDYKKLEWFNGHYIRQKSDGELADLLLPYMQAEGWVASPPTEAQRERLLGLIPIVRERLKVLSDIVPMVRFLYEELTGWNLEELIPKKESAADAARHLSEAAGLLQGAVLTNEADEYAMEERFRVHAEQRGVKIGSILMSVRVAVTGSRVSPPLFASIRLLGLERSLARIDAARAMLEMQQEEPR